MTERLKALAASIPRHTLDAIPRDNPPRKHRGNTGKQDSDITIAVAKYLALGVPKYGDLARICEEHGVTSSSVCTRVSRMKTPLRQ
jgi:hypothetical protein